VPDGAVTLYGTCYSLLAMHYLGEDVHVTSDIRDFVLSTQDATTGLFNGPELVGFEPSSGASHDRDHLLLHLTCTALPVCQQLSIKPRYPIRSAHRFCDLRVLERWLDERDMRHAWFEGNNILFVGQLLAYLRDAERHPGAAGALTLWFSWLDAHADPKTGLWGTNGFCSPMEAVYGGYHQLLVYYHENHPLPNARGLVDTVLGLQHDDGSFHPAGNGGACEDVDAVDILVNCYKRVDYRRAEIRHSLRRCLRHILSIQNADGGFPYNRNRQQNHMGIPGTRAAPNASCTFPTWFRIHTLALIAEVLPSEATLAGIPFRFSKVLSMGWHESPPGWKPVDDSMTTEERMLNLRHGVQRLKRGPGNALHAGRRLGGKMLRRAGLRR
jgi:Prenyltransferase and squalene oxidase repeat